ncbi:DUF6075 family protein [Desulfosporosinus burensis]
MMGAADSSIHKEEAFMTFFHDEAHRQNVLHCLRKKNRINPDGKADNYYLSALYILLSTKNDLYKKTRRFIEGKSINFEKMLSAQDFPSSEIKLIKLAANLFNGSMEVSPSELINTLDDENFEMALQAIFLRRTGCHVLDLLPAVEAVPELEQEDDEEMERY